MDSSTSTEYIIKDGPTHNPALTASSRINIDINEMEKNPKRTKSCKIVISKPKGKD